MKRVINNLKYTYQKYGFLMHELVSRDFKVKYKRSVLGIAWSLLYPVLMMFVMAAIFSNMFKFSMPGVNYLVYLETGLVMFNYFSEASNLAMSSVVGNFGLINKVYLPKYIFPLSKCIFIGVNFLLTLIPLYAVILLTGTGLNWWHLLLPFAFLCLFLFTVGFGFLLATISVFLRDMFYIYGIVITIWTYLTPLMYDIKMLNPTFQFIMKFNPLYQYINFARTIILFGNCPTIGQFAGCAISSLIFLFLGIHVFRKHQDKFIYYV
jgi:ABC-2 type transport system permease protein